MKLAFDTGAEQTSATPFGHPKPEAEVRRIIDCLLPAATPVVTQGGGAIDMALLSKGEGDLVVVLLLKGQINFIRTVSEGILFGAAYAPAVLGLQGSEFRKNSFKYVAQGDCHISFLSRETAIDLISEQRLTREVLNYHAYIADMEVKYSTRLINKTAYEIVCTLLLELTELPEAVRRKTSVAKFILERSNMGRSGMMRILADLRKGDYIDIQNGKLVAILKTLPRYY